MFFKYLIANIFEPDYLFFIIYLRNIIIQKFNAIGNFGIH